jgi:hypothetical protein
MIFARAEAHAGLHVPRGGASRDKYPQNHWKPIQLKKWLVSRLIELPRGPLAAVGFRSCTKNNNRGVGVWEDSTGYSLRMGSRRQLSR